MKRVRLDGLDPALYPRDLTLLPGMKTIMSDQSDKYRVTYVNDIEYAEHDGYKLHIQMLVPGSWTPMESQVRKERYPLVVFVQGSAFRQQNCYMTLPMLVDIARLGYVIASVEYRPSDIAGFPAYLQDVKTAIRFLRANGDEYLIDSDRIAIWGDSSGGNAALMVGVTGDMKEFRTDDYATLQGLMTQNQYERGLLGNFRMLLATVGTMTVNTVVEPLCRFFNGGEVYEQYGWTISLIILAAGFIVVSVITTFFCKERVADDPQESADAVKAQNGPTITECLKSLVVNKYWLLEVGFLFVVFFMMSTFYGSSYYFAQFVLGDSSTFALISNTLTIAQIITMFLTPFFMKKLSKRWVAVIGMGLACVAFLLTALAGSNLMLVVFSNVLKGASFGCAAATMFGLLQDTITYGQWLTNVPAMGMGNAASSFCMKVGSGIGTAALGWILDAGGFDGQAATQTASGITALNIACIWVPIITCAIGGVCLLLFDLDKHYGKAVADLNEGKWKGSK